MKSFIASVAGLAVAGAAAATFNLQITEVYEGVSGDDVTEDWIEITNFGNMDFVFGVDGELYFDDSSADPTEDERVTGITSIGVGESVVVVLGNASSDVSDFVNAWGASNLTGVQIGFLDGDDPGGLSQGGEELFLFDGNSAGAGLVDSTDYVGSNDGVPGRTWTWTGDDNLLSAQSVIGVAGAFLAPVAAGDSGEFQLIGSPGVIPAPAAAGLFGLAGLAAARRRR
jgi:MYXO-CTERM domain-containing protein